MEVSMAEAAQLLGLSIDTVRRRLHGGNSKDAKNLPHKVSDGG
jgi:DNA-directed RNA polymerase specialized sigma24 family protein